jgi:hypothetical protein
VPSELSVAPAAGLNASDLHVATFPTRDQLRRVLASIVNRPESLVVRPLFASASRLTPGSAITIAAAHLGTAPNHAALLSSKARHSVLNTWCRLVNGSLRELSLSPGEWRREHGTSSFKTYRRSRLDQVQITRGAY